MEVSDGSNFEALSTEAISWLTRFCISRGKLLKCWESIVSRTICSNMLYKKRE